MCLAGINVLGDMIERTILLYFKARPSGSVHLEHSRDARIGLIRWQSQAVSDWVELPVYVDDWLDSQNSASIEQVVVHVHGKERDAGVAWADIDAARSRLPIEQQAKILLVVPQFLNGLDKAKFQPAKQSESDRTLLWKSNGWGDGSPSARPKPPRADSAGVSSFEALDAILDHFANQQTYSSVKRIVFSGHSMGGQMVHRYSILSSPDLPAPRWQQLRVEYVIMNPATYLYFCNQREGPPARRMNEYKYGFDNLETQLPTYVGVRALQDPSWYLTRMLQERHVHFVYGAADRGTGDDRPEAMAQGADRRERALNYHRHLEHMEEGAGKQRNRLWTVDWVPGVKHDGRAMTTSKAAIARIFPLKT